MQNVSFAEADAAKRLLIVDDDDLFREALERNLRDFGFQVTSFSDGPSALGYLGAHQPADLLLLDWKMPEMSGIEVLRQMRGSGTHVPVIFLTVLSDQIYEEAALVGGAVDFVEKSRSFAILRRRIEIILDGPKAGGTDPQSSPDFVHEGRLELLPEAGRAHWIGLRVELTVTEFAIVRHLATRAGTDVRYRELYDLVRGDGFAAGVGPDGYRANVRTFIKRIRQKFREIDDEFDQIENYPGFGYRWREDQAGDE